MLSIPAHGMEFKFAHPNTDIVPVTLPFAEPLSNEKSLLANQIAHEMLGIPSRDPSPSPKSINRRDACSELDQCFEGYCARDD
jgi:hypothetical protein